MALPNLKPKRELTYVPGVGVVKKAEFTKEHLKACVDYVKSNGVDVEEYLKKRFEVSSYSDLSLFEGVETVTEKPSDAAEKQPEQTESEEEAANTTEESSEEKPKNKGGRPKKNKSEEEAAK